MAMREFLYDTKPLPEEPDDLVVINPTRVNEPDGAILVYRKEGVLVFDGKQIPIGKIVEGYVSNSNNNPYLPVAYHILLAMDDKNILYDLIYNPDETLFMKLGAKQGASVKNGLEMLLLQAFASWEFWNGKE